MQQVHFFEEKIRIEELLRVYGDEGPVVRVFLNATINRS